MSHPIGYSCWQGVEFNPPACDAFISIDGDDYNALDEKAGAEGWVIGHFDGQAHYACPRCASTLFDAHRLHAWRQSDGIQNGRPANG